ncbi:monooxygenase, flavin-binding family [Nocardioidaceae bacterium Broad-1]|nr:monooxygenase, flavin-binding family [Nocardioidaceae bacterium Broad-1]
MTTHRHVDVLIVGAGLSGVGVASQLTRERTGRTYAILERRTAMGGTWDLFRYPGIRSDSDMFTFGYGFRPWHGTKVLADGPSIKRYIEETADEYGVTRHTHFGRKVVSASWSSERGLWTTTALDETTGEAEEWTSHFLVGATGYYDYDQGHRPVFPGEDRFQGDLIHPQHWPEDLDHTGKRVVVIGSGATAITLVPNMAEKAEHVTMLQRSPTYVVPVPADDPVSAAFNLLKVPSRAVYGTGRVRNILLQQGMYRFCRTAPQAARKAILAAIRAQVGGEVDMKHFEPSYNPWDERLCVVPNGDLFSVLRRGEASIVTDTIDTFTETGIRLASGEELPADIVITATGLKIQLLGGMRVEVDGDPVDTRDRMLYKGTLVEGVPNAMIVMGYTNASWTLKADLAGAYLCRLLKHMARNGHGQVVAEAADDDREEVSVMGASMRSGYIQRGDAVMPRQGKRAPWQIRQDYLYDTRELRLRSVDDPNLRFTSRTVTAPVAAPVGERVPA